MARLSSELVLSLIDHVSGPARGAGRALDRLGAKHVGFGRMTAAASAGMGRAQSMMLAGASSVAAPLLGGFAAKEVVTAAADFETQLAEIGKKGGYTAAQLAKIGAEAKALSSSGKVASSLEDIMAGYNRAAAASIPLDEMGQFVQLTTKVGDAFEMSGEDASNAFLGFNKTIGLGFGQMERYADLINSLADSGIADEKQIVGFIDRAGASLKAAGLTKEQIAALGATAANIKMPEDVAANTFSTLVNKLLSPGSPKAQKALAGIVGNMSDFNSLLKKDANKALEAFLVSVSKLDKFKGAELLGGFIGSGYDDEVMRVAAAYGELARNRELAEGDSYAGSLTKSYQAKLKTFWSQWQVAQNALKELSIDVGTAGLPGLISGLETARGIVKEIGEGYRGFSGLIDHRAFAQAGDAIERAIGGVSRLLAIEPGDNGIAKAFQDIAKMANDAAWAIGEVERVFDRMADTPMGKLVVGDKEGAAKRLGTTVDPETGRLNKVPMKGGLLPGVTRWLGEQTGSPTDLPPVSERNRENRLVPRHPAPRPTFRESENAAQAAYQDMTLGPVRRTGEVPAPTPRPDIAAVFAREGEAAAQAAEAVGQRIQNAFAVTAEAKVTVDTREIDAAQAALNRLIATAGQVGPAVRAAQRAAAAPPLAADQSTGRVDYSGLHQGD